MSCDLREARDRTAGPTRSESTAFYEENASARSGVACDGTQGDCLVCHNTYCYACAQADVRTCESDRTRCGACTSLSFHTYGCLVTTTSAQYGCASDSAGNACVGGPCSACTKL